MKRLTIAWVKIRKYFGFNIIEYINLAEEGGIQESNFGILTSLIFIPAKSAIESGGNKAS